MPLWHILDLMPNNASFTMAAAALKERYQKRIKTIHDIMDGKERLEFPGTKNFELSKAMIWRFLGISNNFFFLMAVIP